MRLMRWPKRKGSENVEEDNMPGKGCRGGRKHTPITTQKERGFFGAELARKRAGQKGKTKMSEAELSRHLKESKGKKLPKSKKGK